MAKSYFKQEHEFGMIDVDVFKGSYLFILNSE